jgi:hypothetical protein
VVAVHLRARSDEDPLVEAVAVVENDLRPFEVRDQRAHRLLDDQADAHRSREVVDDVTLVDELAHDGVLQHGVDDEVEPGPLAEVGDVAVGARRKVVERIDLPPVVEEELAQVRTDEPGASRYERGPRAAAVGLHGGQA